jgi:hypothetical protein
MPSSLHIIFDGPPGTTPGRFVEVEDDEGRSVRAGEWHKRPDGLWELVIPAAEPFAEWNALPWYRRLWYWVFGAPEVDA